MPKVTIRREGITVEAELTFDQVKELVGVNGHRPIADPAQSQLFEVKSTESRSRRKKVSTKRAIKPGDFKDFYRGLSERARQFLNIVHDNPGGISAEKLAPTLGFNTANQIGGLTGPGVVKIAHGYGFKADDLYTSVVTFVGTKRERMFYPGKLLLEMEKPA
jgi:hypothetical protein